MRYPGAAGAPDLAAWEQATYGLTGAEAGAMLLEHWRFSAATVSAVRSHVAPATAGEVGAAAMLHLAGAAADGWGFGLAGERPVWRDDPAMLALAGITEDGWRELVRRRGWLTTSGGDQLGGGGVSRPCFAKASAGNFLSGFEGRMAEGVRFELTVSFRPRQFSRLEHKPLGHPSRRDLNKTGAVLMSMHGAPEEKRLEFDAMRDWDKARGHWLVPGLVRCGRTGPAHTFHHPCSPAAAVAAGFSSHESFWIFKEAESRSSPDRRRWCGLNCRSRPPRFALHSRRTSRWSSGTPAEAGQKAVSKLIAPAEFGELYERTLRQVDALLKKHEVLYLPLTQAEQAFAPEAVKTPGVHVRFAYADDLSWASAYPRDKLPSEVAGLLADTRRSPRRSCSRFPGSSIADAERINPRAETARIKVARSGAIFANEREIQPGT